MVSLKKETFSQNGIASILEVLQQPTHAHPHTHTHTRKCMDVHTHTRAVTLDALEN